MQSVFVQQKSALICAHLKTFITDHKFTKVCSFFSFKNEPSLFELQTLLPTVSFFYPVLSGDTMSFYCWSQGEELCQNAFGISEPLTIDKSPLLFDKETVILVPALAVDKSGTRLGYGGGYYDRVLEHGGVSICVVFDEFFIEESLPKDVWDIPVSRVCTEKGLV